MRRGENKYNLQQRLEGYRQSGCGAYWRFRNLFYLLGRMVLIQRCRLQDSK